MKALSIRQPWAWLILHGGKDVENRNWPTRVRGRVLIHAALGITRFEYNYACLSARCNGAPDLVLPRYEALERGGIIGSVEITGCSRWVASLWFDGPFGFLLKSPEPCAFHPCKGRLGFFDVAWPPPGG